MVSVASLLNPTAPGPRNQQPQYQHPQTVAVTPNSRRLQTQYQPQQIRYPPVSPQPVQYPSTTSPCKPEYTVSSSYTSSPFLIAAPFVKKPKMAKDGAVFAKNKVKGAVNFPPYEKLGADSTKKMKPFKIYPSQKIMDYPRHIPYNSEKKSFLDKTGRESFEVFQYIFVVPGEDKEFTVMWDYNVGLVRITPFFKALKYSKTMPAKMIGLNPGLKELTHSITGGALVAQGYWMPFSCALAVCQTFCEPIAPALIPLFGPDFPSRCVSVTSAVYGRMVIENDIIVSATQEAESFRQHYSTAHMSSMPTPTSSTVSASPRERSLPLNENGATSPYASPLHISKRMRLNRIYTNESAYSTEADTDEAVSRPNSRYLHSPVSPSCYTSSAPNSQDNWRPLNHPQTPMEPLLFTAISNTNATPPRTSLPHGPQPYPGHRPTLSSTANPWLSSIPRSVNMDSSPNPGGHWRPGITAVSSINDDRHTDDGYEAEAEASASSSPNDSDTGGSAALVGGDGVAGGTEKKAAWLLMNLSVRDAEKTAGGAEANDRKFEHGGLQSEPRSLKRRRALSF